jgi:FkbM family methyltransferase
MDEKAIISTLNEAYFSANPDEQQVIALMPNLLRGVEVFVDVGASLGQFTKAASQSLRGGTIVAVEADPLRHRELQKNCLQWAATSGNSIRAVHGAASNRPGTLRFQITNSSVSGGLFQHGLDHLSQGARRNVTWTEVSVQALTLDELLIDLTPGFVKMDIEGAEILALEGATKLLQQPDITWLIELHDFTDPLGRRPVEVVPPMMEQLGYRTIIIGDKHLFTRNPWGVAPLAYIKSTLRHWGRRVKRALFRAKRH